MTVGINVLGSECVAPHRCLTKCAAPWEMLKQLGVLLTFVASVTPCRHDDLLYAAGQKTLFK